MKNTQLFLLACLAAVSAGCKQEPAEKPKVTYDAAKKEKAVPKADTAQIEVADLPIHIPGTAYLIHPVGDLNFGAGKPKYDASGAAANTASFQISNYDEGEITGYLRNLKFQPFGSDSIVSLSDKPLLIQSAKFLRALAERNKQQVMVYTLADMDTNQDGKLDTNDIKSLYMSEMGGARFTKISADMQELIDWSVVESQNKLYFRTIEDTNKNGEFDPNDLVHYYFIDLSDKDWKVSDYKPI